MTTDLAIAVIGGGAVIIAAVVGVFGVLYGHLSARLSGLEADNRTMWAYCRKLLDLYYRNRREGAPDPDPLPNEP